MKQSAILLLLFLVPLCSEVSSAQITVAAAADLGPVLSQISKDYRQATGHVVNISLGSSGNLTQQIKNDAPFDVLLSADEDYPKQLIEGGFADSGSLYGYAIGRLALWVAASSSLDLSRGIDVLLDPSVKKIAIANPLHAPYGRAAVAALKHFGLYDKLQPRFVLGENVSQAAQFVESGNAQAGLIALSHALAPAMKMKGRYWVVPSQAYPELRQAAVIISRSSHKDEASAFIDYLKKPAVRSLLSQYGFSIPGDQH